MEVTTLQNYSHQEGYMTEQCVIFASNERVKEILEPHTYGPVYSVGYCECIKLLVEAGIQVVPVIGFASDGFNQETENMADYKEDAPGLHFHGRQIMRLESVEKLIADAEEE
ncbi:hypothetical protein [Bacillus phage CP-51]|uniref:Uncharacterized protein n=1 Tax=Bacillus phage CP-51 TaxID=1391188 RepID=A0A068EMI5_9CAUD|nr:hypothetical protein OZ73_gp168 [Bacillus phage CP-51]AID50603.1 hypothetical protein [Bacillus phage CP-51]